jgi:hypothetical protein
VDERRRSVKNRRVWHRKQGKISDTRGEGEPA